MESRRLRPLPRDGEFDGDFEDLEGELNGELEGEDEGEALLSAIFSQQTQSKTPDANHSSGLYTSMLAW